MASQHSDNTCLMCFESRPLKIVGNCNHSFCSECLSTVLDSLDNGIEVFPCPSCKADCPRPWDGVKGLVDVPMVHHEQEEANDRDTTSGETTCGICTYNSLDVQAINICSECGHLPICADCSKKHKTNKATSNHSLTPIARRMSVEAVCRSHKKPLDRYCKVCTKPVCAICVSVDHGEHDVEKMAFMIRSIHQDVEIRSEKKRDKLKKQQEVKKTLLQLKDAAKTVDEPEMLIKEIEDHAKKYIDKIVKWKEDLKEEVKRNYKVVRDIPENLEKFTDDILKLEVLVSRASKLLSQTEHHPTHLDKLMTLQHDLEAHEEIHEDIISRDYRSELFELKFNGYKFVQEKVELPDNLGKIEILKRNLGSWLSEKFSYTMPVDSKDMYIPSVAMLGSHFAVAHPVKPEQTADAIDIYEFPKTFKCTLREQVFPLHDMCSIPDGKLAVLSDGTGENSCCVKVFDVETGYKNSTRDLDVAKPLSLGVTPLQEYVILGYNSEGQKQITLLDRNNEHHISHTIDATLDEGKKDFDKISCGGRYIFLKGDTSVCIYGTKGTGLHRLEMCPIEKMSGSFNISATVWEDFLEGKCHGETVYVHKRIKEKNFLKWSKPQFYGSVRPNAANKDKIRISTTDGHYMVVSQGQVFKVYST